MGTTDRPVDDRSTTGPKRTGLAGLTDSPGAIRGGVALVVLLAIYLVGALSHLHVLSL